MALYQCTWRWPGVEDPKERHQRFARVTLAVDDAKPEVRRCLKGWFGYPGEWAGFLLIEAETTEQLQDMLHPFTGLMHFEVKALIQIDYDQAIQGMRMAAGDRA